MTDQELMELFATQPSLAVEELQARYYGFCYGIAYRVLRDQEDAQECVNDVLLRCYQVLPRQRPGSFQPYLRAMTRNQAISVLRARQMKKRGGDMIRQSYEDYLGISGGELADSVCESQAIRQSIGDFLTRRPPEDRDLFLKRYQEDVSIGALAEEFSLTESCVKVRLLRMRRSLRSELQANDIYL